MLWNFSFFLSLESWDIRIRGHLETVFYAIDANPESLQLPCIDPAM